MQMTHRKPGKGFSIPTENHYSPSLAQFLGAFIGAVIVYLAYLPHWAETTDPGLIWDSNLIVKQKF